ncbi:MAG TPA: hypothetical protein VNG51_11810 [Ktedonobacteraceae bacterium]|nr:hypothetical protein [Ktedonobacteraceae bacterium]
MATTRVRHYYDRPGASRRTTVIIVVAHPCGRQVTLQQPCSYLPPSVMLTQHLM